MSGEFTVNPAEVLVEEGAREQAREFVDGEDDFSHLSEEHREAALESIARALTAIEIALLLEEVGTKHDLIVSYQINSNKKAAVLLGEKTEKGVKTHIHWTDQEIVDDILSQSGEIE